ncbi:hypothetical protein QBC34DRAFT_438682 [Podospora aff. communis PSN243]|uniref:Ankyrin n=1 Tax=Podospora aff. communis PSN243 TaxID=3040156 RepID=A0AAV9GMF5_9PEZI|nr:hypothetical protein QBC34DRAFT_438682 [Podospora aff. communis PSN243]
MEIAAAVIGITNITIRTSADLWGLCDTWRDAPKELHYLRDDLVRAQEFLAQVKVGIDKLRLNHPVSDAVEKEPLRQLEVLLKKGLAVVSEIETIVHRISDGRYYEKSETESISWLDAKPEALSKRRRMVWLSKAGRIGRLRTMFKEIGMGICASLISLNVTISMAVMSSLAESEADILSQIRESEEMLSKAIHQSQDSTVLRIEKRLETISSHIGARIDDSTGVHSSRSEFSSVDAFMVGMATSKSLSQNPLLGQCDRSCLCRCHWQQKRRAGAAMRGKQQWQLQSLQKVFGSATLDYSGALTRWTRCDDASCRSRKAKTGETVKFHYQFPAWLLNIVICLFFSTALFGGPELLLRVRHAITIERRTTSIFGYIDRADLAGLKSLLRDRRGSVHDVLPIAGDESPLLYAVKSGIHDIRLVRLLLQAGADPNEEDAVRNTPLMAVTAKFESGTEWGKQLSQLFRVDDLLQDEEKYTVLHRIILGMLPLRLEDVLHKENVRAQLSARAWTGDQPLHLAIRRGNLDASVALIRAGADVNAPEPMNHDRTPLHYAARGGYTEIARLLLQHGAGVDTRDDQGFGPIHLAAAAGSVDVVALLIQHGVDVNTAHTYGAHALAFAASAGSIPVIRYLLDHGADMNNRDDDGDVALYEAVAFRRHEAARLFLDRGADLSNINESDRSFLHLLAIAGDVEMMRIFASKAESLRGLDREGRDSTGKTPRQLFRERANIEDMTPQSLALREAFNHLLALVGQDAPQGVVTVGLKGEDGVRQEEEEEEFFEASERRDEPVMCSS